MAFMAKWLGAGLLALGMAMGARAVEAGEAPAATAAPVADPAVWGPYARLVGTTWNSEAGAASWQWGPDNSIVETCSGCEQSVIRPGANRGELVSVYGSGFHTWDGRIAADGSVLWIRRGLVKQPSRLSIVDGHVVQEAVKLDKANQVAKVTRTYRYDQTGGASVSAPLAAVVPAAHAKAPAGASAAPAAAPPVAKPAPRPAAVPVAAAPVAAKKGPRRLSEAELATLRSRIQHDKVRRAQALASDQAFAEEEQRKQQQWELEQAQIAAAEEYSEEDEPSAPAPNPFEVFANTFNNEMAKYQAEREQQDAFVRDLQRQQAEARERREREQERQRQAAEQARYQQQYAQQVQGPSAQEVAQQQAQARAAAARERELATQAAAERARQQQLRAQQQQASASAASKPAASEAAGKPLRFVLSIDLKPRPGDSVNPTCYSNVITRPGPPGWGGGGFLPAGSGEQARQVVQGYKARFIAACRASGREITSEGNFHWTWNELRDGEQQVANTRAQYREDFTVSL